MTTPRIEASITPQVFPVYATTHLDVQVDVLADIPAGSTLSCQLPNSFLAAKISQSVVCTLQTENPHEEGFVQIILKPAEGTSRVLKPHIRKREFYSGCDIVRHGQCLDVCFDHTLTSGDRVIFHYANMHSPWVANQTEQVYVAIDGQTPETSPTFRVLPGPASYVRAIAPSVVRPGEAFRLLLVSLDAYHNISSTSYPSTTVTTMDGEPVAESPSFCGRCEVEMTLTTPGMYRLCALDVLSNPIRVSATHDKVYWGDLHSHSDMSVDAVGYDNYQYAQDASGLDFCAVSDHGAVTHPFNWERTKMRAAAADKPGRFLPILAYELNLGYHLNLYFPDLEGEMVDVPYAGDSAPDADSLAKLLDTYPGIITQLHHTGIQFALTDMTKEYHSSTKLFEIYSQHGQSEMYNPDHVLSYENCRREQQTKFFPIGLDGPYYARDAWATGKRFFSIGSSDDHFSQPGKCHFSLTGIRAPELTREALFNSMHTGQCYATTGERILLDFSINDTPMGATLSLKKTSKPLTFHLEVHGTGHLQHVEVMRYRFNMPNESWKKVWSKDYPFSRAPKDLESLDLGACWEEEDASPAVYYVRVRQTQTTLSNWPVYAWSSPIWVE